MTLVITLLLSFLIVLSVIGVMAIGILFGNEKIRGSCGGISADGCQLCGNDRRVTKSSET